MGLFNKKKKDTEASAPIMQDDALKDEISKAYDEIMAGGAEETRGEQPAAAENSAQIGDMSDELFKSRIQAFKAEHTQENLLAVIKMLPKRQFVLPSVSNMEEPVEKDGDKARLKEGAVLNPALLNSKDGKVFLPIFTSDKEMTQKSPSGIVLKLPFEQCVGIVYDEKNPVKAVVINPFTDNMIIGEELLRQVFIPKKKDE